MNLCTGPLSTQKGVRTLFCTRNGGVSEGVFTSLNCGLGSGDEATRVGENRARAMAKIGLPVAALCTAYQSHGARCVTVVSPWEHGDRPKVDAMVTDRPGIALGVLTADCAPVLFADSRARVVGVAHAGWRGALAGVLEETVAAMGRHGADTGAVVAAIGPCIGAASYEVGPEFQETFLAEDPGSADLFRAAARDRHFLFDLPGYLARRLIRLGLRAIERIPCDTAADEARFFSYRRARLCGEPDYGRQLSAIALGR